MTKNAIGIGLLFKVELLEILTIFAGTRINADINGYRWSIADMHMHAYVDAQATNIFLICQMHNFVQDILWPQYQGKIKICALHR